MTGTLCPCVVRLGLGLGSLRCSPCDEPGVTPAVRSILRNLSFVTQAAEKALQESAPSPTSS